MIPSEQDILDYSTNGVLLAVIGHVKGKTSHLRMSYKTNKKTDRKEMNFELQKYNFSNNGDVV